MKGLSQDNKDLSSVNRNELLSVKKVIDNVLVFNILTPGYSKGHVLSIRIIASPICNLPQIASNDETP